MVWQNEEKQKTSLLSYLRVKPRKYGRCDQENPRGKRHPELDIQTGKPQNMHIPESMAKRLMSNDKNINLRSSVRDLRSLLLYTFSYDRFKITKDKVE